MGAIIVRYAERSIPFAIPVALFFAVGLLIPGYIGVLSLLSLLVLASLLGIAAIGQTITVLIGGIDLSIPAVIGLADVLLALLYGQGYPILGVILFIVVVSASIGALNGYISYRLQVSPLVVTLATSSILFGAIWASTHGEVTGKVPQWLTDFVSIIANTGPIPLPPVVTTWIVVSAIALFAMNRSVLGRWIYATGANSRAANLAGIPIGAVWMIAFGTSAVFASVTGILLAGFSGSTNPTVGQTYLFTTIASVVVGGTSLIGGRGGYARTIAGSFVITELTTLFVGLGLDESAQQICLGLLLIALVTIYGRESHISMRV